MGKYIVQHDRENCIGCGACVAVCPDNWEINEKDGKSNLINGKKIQNGWYEKEVEDLSCNKDAADSCPVNVIHIVEKTTNKKII